MAEPYISIGTLITVIGGIIAFVIRERSKDKEEKKSNGHLSAVKKTVDGMNGKIDTLDLKVDRIENKVTAVKVVAEERKEFCKQTVARFEKAIVQTQKEVLDIAKRAK